MGDATPAPMNADAFQEYLVDIARKGWLRYIPDYGPFEATWVGGPASTEKRLNLLVGLFFHTAARHHNRDWLVELDEDLAIDKTGPTGLILSRSSWDVKVFDLKITRKLLRPKDEQTGETHVLRLDKGGDGVTMVLAEIITDFFYPGCRTA
jgi:hypothetical protein